jgi:hypothetical protein
MNEVDGYADLSSSHLPELDEMILDVGTYRRVESHILSPGATREARA